MDFFGCKLVKMFILGQDMGFFLITISLYFKQLCNVSMPSRFYCKCVNEK